MDLITITRESGLEFSIRVRGHGVTSDMAEADGGRDRGPSPAELLGAALGACTAMMAQRYCEGRGWDGDAGANLTLELADNPKRVGRIVLDLELPASVPDDKKDIVKEVVGGCLLQETLKHPPAVDIDIA